jgi:hypothetical protein
MEKSEFEFQENYWVKASQPLFARGHRLAIVDTEFAHTYCGKIFYLCDLVALKEEAAANKCFRCVTFSPQPPDAKEENDESF